MTQNKLQKLERGIENGMRATMGMFGLLLGLLVWVAL